MGIKISKDHLHPSVIESITSLIGDLSQLETTAKGNAVEAINELLANGGNKEELEALIAEIAEGKELIANAVGEPLTAEESFNEMSNDINGLLSTFKTNMMNNGITVEAGDKFKALIDKIATMVEEGSGKGIQFASGTGTVVSKPELSSNGDFIEVDSLSFKPTIILAHFDKNTHVFFDSTDVDNNNGEGYFLINSAGVTRTTLDDDSIVTDSGFRLWIYGLSRVGLEYNWVAIGVGEEDTTLRDSLASILEEEGVSVTEEDDMASLISKVDEEFDRKNEEIENIQQNVIPIKKIIVTDTLPTTVTDDIVLLTNIPAPNIYTTQIPDDYGYNDNYDNWSNVIPVEGDIVFNLAHGYNDSNTYNKIIISYDNVTITLTIMDIYQYINGEWDGSIMYKAYGNKNGVWTRIN